MSVSRMYITRMYREFMSSLQSRANTICRNRLNEDYIKKSFNKCTAGYVYTSDEGAQIGFVIWKEYKNQQMKGGGTYSYLHILLICAEENDFNFGGRILEDVDKYATSNAFNYIQLEPANEKLRSYYTKNGYISDTIGPMMKKQVNDNYIVKRNNNSRSTRKRTTVRPTSYITNDNRIE